MLKTCRILDDDFEILFCEGLFITYFFCEFNHDMVMRSYIDIQNFRDFSLTFVWSCIRALVTNIPVFYLAICIAAIPI